MKGKTRDIGYKTRERWCEELALQLHHRCREWTFSEAILDKLFLPNFLYKPTRNAGGKIAHHPFKAELNSQARTSTPQELIKEEPKSRPGGVCWSIRSLGSNSLPGMGGKGGLGWISTEISLRNQNPQRATATVKEQPWGVQNPSVSKKRCPWNLSSSAWVLSRENIPLQKLKNQNFSSHVLGPHEYFLCGSEKCQTQKCTGNVLGLYSWIPEDPTLFEGTHPHSTEAVQGFTDNTKPFSESRPSRYSVGVDGSQKNFFGGGLREWRREWSKLSNCYICTWKTIISEALEFCKSDWEDLSITDI